MLKPFVLLRANGPSHVASADAGAAVIAIALAILIAVTPIFSLSIGAAFVVALILALVFPWLAWLGLAFALPVASAIHFGPALLTDFLIAAAIGLWAASMISQRRNLDKPLLPVWPVALYLLVLYLSSLGAVDLDEALTEMVKWVEFGLLLVVLPMAMPTRVVPWLVAAMLAAGALQGLYGLYQFIYRIGPDWFLIQGRFMRASGVFGQPNPYGGYLGLSLPVAFSLTLWGMGKLFRGRRLIAFLWTLFYAATALCIGIGLIASWSRGGWLGAVAGLITVLAFFHRRTALLLGIALLLVLMTALVGAISPDWIPSAISAWLADIPAYFGFVDVLTLEVNDDNFAIIERVAHWIAALRMWEIAPWLGVGPGNYAAVYPMVALPRWSDALGHAHNIYLNVLGETGLLGLGAFMLLWSTLIWWLLKQIRAFQPAQSWSRALAVGVLGVTAHLAIHCIFDNLFVQGIYLHLALWFAAVALCTSPTLLMDVPASNASTFAPFSESDE